MKETDMVYIENVNTGDDGVRFSLIVGLFAMALVPLCIFTVVLSMLAAVNVRSAMSDEVLSRMNATAYSLSEMYNAIDSGDYCLAEDGLLFKGDVPEAGFSIRIDEMAGVIKKSTRYDVAAFWGDEFAGGFAAGTDDEGMAGIFEPTAPAVREALKNGGHYDATELSAEGSDFYGYYVPLYLNDGSVVGMAFADMPEERIGTAFSIVMGSIIVTAIIIFMMSVFVLAVSSRRFTYRYGAAVPAVNNQLLG